MGVVDWKQRPQVEQPLTPQWPCHHRRWLVTSDRTGVTSAICTAPGQRAWSRRDSLSRRLPVCSPRACMVELSTLAFVWLLCSVLLRQSSTLGACAAER